MAIAISIDVPDVMVPTAQESDPPRTVVEMVDSQPTAPHEGLSRLLTDKNFKTVQKLAKLANMRNTLAWFDDDEIVELHYALLKGSVSSLIDARTDCDHKDDIHRWVADDSVHPFSFRKCCELEGCDPEIMRMEIDRMVKKFAKESIRPVKRIIPDVSITLGPETEPQENNGSPFQREEWGLFRSLDADDAA